MNIEEFEVRLNAEHLMQEHKRQTGIVPFKDLLDLLQATVLLECLKLLKEKELL